MIVAVLVTGQHAVQSLTGHLDLRMFGIATSIGQTLRQPTRVTPTLIELADRQQPRVGTDRLRTRLDNNGFLWEKIELKLIDSLFRHHAASVRFKLVLNNQVRTHAGRFFKSPTNNPG